MAGGGTCHRWPPLGRRALCDTTPRGPTACGKGPACATQADECGAQARPRAGTRLAWHGWTSAWLAAAVALVVVAACLPSASGAVIKGSIRDVGEFLFIDKFCFDTTPLSVAQQVRAGTLPPSHGAIMRFVEFQADVPLTVAVYNDGVDFDHLLENQDSLSCSDLLKDALFTQAVEAGGQRFEKVVWQESRPRFWFVAIAACADAPKEEGETTALTYELHMLNPGGTFQRQFSKDKQLELEAYIAALAIHVLLAVPMVYGSIKKAKSEALSSAFRVLTACVVAATVALALFVAHNAVFATDGIGVPAIFTIGTAVDRLQNIAFMLLLVTMMKGWNTSYSQLRQRVVVCNVILASALVLGYIMVFLWEILFDAPANAFYLYESPPGVWIVVLRLVIACWFVWSCYKRITKTHSRKKKTFFVKFAGLGVLYYLALPVVVVVAAVLEPWFRSKVVVILTLIVNILAFVPVAYLLWPARMEDIFNTVETITIQAKRDVPRDPNVPTLNTPALGFTDSKHMPEPRTSLSLTVTPPSGPGAARLAQVGTASVGSPKPRRTNSWRPPPPRPRSSNRFSRQAVSAGAPSAGPMAASPPSSRPTSSATVPSRPDVSTMFGRGGTSHGAVRPAPVGTGWTPPPSGASAKLLLTPSHHVPRPDGSATKLPPLRGATPGSVSGRTLPGLGTGRSTSPSSPFGPEEWPEVPIVDASGAPYRRTLSRHVFNPL